MIDLLIVIVYYMVLFHSQTHSHMWDSVIVLCFVVGYMYYALGKRAGCFVLFVFLVSRDCCVTLPHDTTGLSEVWDCCTCIP